MTMARKKVTPSSTSQWSAFLRLEKVLNTALSPRPGTPKALFWSRVEATSLANSVDMTLGGLLDQEAPVSEVKPIKSALVAFHRTIADTDETSLAEAWAALLATAWCLSALFQDRDLIEGELTSLDDPPYGVSFCLAKVPEKELKALRREVGPPPLVLGDTFSDPVFVRGKPKLLNSYPRWKVLKALVDAGPGGLAKDDLLKVNSDALHILRRLRENDPDWQDVILMAGTRGNRYRIAPK